MRWLENKRVDERDKACFPTNEWVGAAGAGSPTCQNVAGQRLGRSLVGEVTFEGT